MFNLKKRLNFSQPTRVRAAPSPTGDPHLGNLRTALFDYLFAKAQKGKFIIRIEDTDQKRKVNGATEKFLDALEWLGLTWDEGPDYKNKVIVGEKGRYGSYWQSRRLAIYQKYATKLIKQKQAYYCFCNEATLDKMRAQQIKDGQLTKYDGRCQLLSKKETAEKISQKIPSVIRLKAPKQGEVSFHDYLRGEIKVAATEIEDQILIKSDGYPTYHLASVVDDHLMKITQVLRGEEWLPSTPKHIVLYKLFGWQPPVYVHLPLVVDANHKKLGKRYGAMAVNDLVAAGYLPEAVLNYLVFLGWRPKDDQREIYTLVELVSKFKLADLNKAPAVYDPQKLNWFNAQHIKKMPIQTLVERLKPYLNAKELKTSDKNFLTRLATVEQTRLVKLTDIKDSIQIFNSPLIYDKELLRWKQMDFNTVRKQLRGILRFLEELPAPHWTLTDLDQEIKRYINQNNLPIGEVLWPLRIALSGVKQGPSPFDCAYILGREKTIDLLQKTINNL